MADSQQTFGVSNCYGCLGLSTFEQLEIGLLATIAMAADAQTLVSQGACYACYGSSTYEILKLALLRQISLAQNPARDVSPQGLFDQAKCLGCSSSATAIQMLELALLAQIAGL